jgi:hypothetical protein
VRWPSPPPGRRCRQQLQAAAAGSPALRCRCGARHTARQLAGILAAGHLTAGRCDDACAPPPVGVHPPCARPQMRLAARRPMRAPHPCVGRHPHPVVGRRHPDHPGGKKREEALQGQPLLPLPPSAPPTQPQARAGRRLGVATTLGVRRPAPPPAGVAPHSHPHPVRVPGEAPPAGRWHRPLRCWPGVRRLARQWLCRAGGGPLARRLRGTPRQPCLLVAPAAQQPGQRPWRRHQARVLCDRW